MERKFSYILLILILAVSCKGKKVEQPKVFYPPEYVVTKIDSINSYYIIYLKKDTNFYKLVSKKQQIYQCNKLLIGNSYPLLLNRLLHTYKSDVNSKYPINDIEFRNCLKMDDSTEICRERYMDDIYSSNNIMGLCFIKN